MRSWGRGTRLWAALCWVLLSPGAAHAAGLPTVESGHRPGPDILYAPPAEAPQLQNVGIWQAPPILVSGACAYRDGEFLYQDFLYDDHGAAGVHDQSHVTSFMFTNFAGSPWAGTVTYPTDPVFANNAADLVELRVKRIGRAATAFRVTVNSLVDPERTAFTIALGSSAEPRDWPHGAGVRSPAELFLTVNGGTAELREASTGEVRAPSPTAAVDSRRRQFDVRVPRAAWDPGEQKVPMRAGVGLWDAAAGRYLAPQAAASESAPGGAAPSGAALFNVAFRCDEPMPDWDLIRKSYTIGDMAVVSTVDSSWWRERAQADALRVGDVSPFFAEVDFGKLAKRVDDDSNVPETGPINRILASRFSFGQGVDWTRMCSRAGVPCIGPFVGELQPYALYIPDKPRPANGWSLTWLFHAWVTNHNMALGSNYQSQLGERGEGSLVATPLPRGPDGAYADMAEADVFEVWADLARQYELQPDRVAATGFSMGSTGAYHLPGRWPDLFTRTFLVGGVPLGDIMKSLRNVPLMTWMGVLDEGTSVDLHEESVRLQEEAGLRFVFDHFPTADHLTVFTNDEWGPAADFLGEHQVDRSPPRITYIIDPTLDSARAGAVADHAYWLSDLKVRDPQGAPTGEIDVRSEAFGVGVPPPLGVTESVEILEGGSHGPMPYRHRQQDWGQAPIQPKADRLIIESMNVAQATVDVRRARVSCQVDLDVETDGPLRITLSPCGKTLAFDDE